MAVLYKQKGRKPTTRGPISVGYGNYAVPGLLENKHVKMTVGHFNMENFKPYTLSMTMIEAEKAAIEMLRIAMEFNGLKFSRIKSHLLQPGGLGSTFVPTED